jgi:hypothetical protein
MREGVRWRKVAALHQAPSGSGAEGRERCAASCARRTGRQRRYRLRVSAASGTAKAAGRAASSGSAGLPAMAEES